ncbi:MAG: tetratricopeptide repeat protein [Proteobacteria bacterium]|nr:tetratricopeptide repeat protein [Pseudomonadota bacterium]
MASGIDAAKAALTAADDALVRGFPGEAEKAFAEALAGFRAPDLRLGEAHALRGLAQCHLATGRTDVAQAQAREAVAAYQQLRAMLEQDDSRGTHAVIWRDALEAEAASLVLLAEILLREGQGHDARETLSFARAIYQELGVAKSEGGALSGMGRVALREGRLRDAEEAFLKALQAHRQTGHIAGQVGSWLHLAELYRIEGRIEDAERALNAARPLAHDTESPLLVARVLAALGAVMLQVPRPASAQTLYEEALPRIREAGDREMEGFAQLGLGQALSRQEDPGALDHLAAGIGVLAELGHHHGLAGGMHRVAEHGLRVDRPILALVAAETSRRLWATTDPVRGVGQALRLVVKSLSALRAYRETLTAALAREAVAGSIQPNAVEVAAYYRDHLPKKWTAELEGLSESELLTEVSLRTAGVLATAQVEIDVESLSTVEGALRALHHVLAGLPRVAAEVDPLDEPTDLHVEPSAHESVPIPAALDTGRLPEESS